VLPLGRPAHQHRRPGHGQQRPEGCLHGPGVAAVGLHQPSQTGGEITGVDRLGQRLDALRVRVDDEHEIGQAHVVCEPQRLEGGPLVEFAVPGQAHHLAVLTTPRQLPGETDRLGDTDAEAVAHGVAETEVAVDDAGEPAVECGQRGERQGAAHIVLGVERGGYVSASHDEFGRPAAAVVGDETQREAGPHRRER
jgi:hypothetical protein